MTAQAPGNRVWDSFLILLLAGSVALVFWYESIRDPGLRATLVLVDLGLCVFFVLEWLWRLARAQDRGAWALHHTWELLGMIPLAAPLPGFLRVLRLLRLVRIVRVFGRIGERIGVWERIARESHILKIAMASGLVTLVGALLVWLLERNEPGAKIGDFRTALWWAIVTVTTVGYGDVTPISATGQFVAAMLMITGIGTIGLLASSLASVLIVREESERPETVAAPPVMAGNLVDQLSTLAGLHERGRLTDEEYERAKALVIRPAE